MDLELNLSDEATKLLHAMAAREGRPVDEVVRLAILERCEHGRRVEAATRRVAREDREILDRLKDA